MRILNAFRLGLVATLGVGLGWLILNSIVTLSTILTYIGAALFIALGLEPIIGYLERRRVPRWLAIIIVLVVVIAVLVAVLWAIIPVLIEQGSGFVSRITVLVENAAKTDWLGQLQEQFPDFDIQGALDNLWRYVQNNAASIGGGAVQIGINVGLGIATAVFGAIIVLILTIYFTASLNTIKRAAYQLVPASKRSRFTDLSEQITESVGKYVMGQVLLALVNGVLSAVILSIIGAPFPLLLAVVAFLFSLIPLVGTLTGSIIIVLLTLLLSSPLTALVAAIWYVIYMQLEAYVLSPRIMNRAVQVPGAVVVIAALAGGALLGILGALVAIPVAASIMIIIKQVVVPRQNEL